ncbi:MAG: hypothetical protein H0U40_02550 [Chloroflexia bacterium]|nr:hypothetical protein [Chloroflexia bacterium]
MSFGPFILLSLFYAVIGVRVIAQLVRSWRPTFDRRFTAEDRSLVDQAAFFILLPISVALHELGHAAAVKGFGGRIVDWGYYAFAGFVSYDPRPFSDLQRILVALAGPLVSIVLGLAALVIVFLRRPPLRPAFNELLTQFAALSIINAAVFYPLLDVVSGLGGDWSQIYRGGVPVVSGVIFLFHLALLVGGIWAFRNPGVQARVATLTGAPAGTERRFMGGLERRERPFTSPSPEATVAHEAARRAAGGWPPPVQVAVQNGLPATRFAVGIVWTTGADPAPRGVMIRIAEDGSIELRGHVADPTAGPGTVRGYGLLRPFPAPPDVDALTMATRIAMEDVERHSAARS